MPIPCAPATGSGSLTLLLRMMAGAYLQVEHKRPTLNGI